MAEISRILDDFVPSANEAQTERYLVQPVLAALDHSFEVQASMRTPDGTKTPDYVFYWNDGARVENQGKVLTEELLASRAFAVGDAKHWDRKLDVATRGLSGDPFNNRNPSYQIAFYIQHSGLEWGILTNGRLWRLYHKDTAHKLDRFYEVDLLALVESESVDQFLYFYAFFRRRAFDQHPLSVSEILQASEDYARGIGDSIKKQVFNSLRHLAQGFLDYPDNRLEPDQETLDAIYDNSLIILYRLLFILYGEARGLLPARQRGMYQDQYSLHAISRDIARNIDSGRRLLPTSAVLWPRLRELFRIINDGSPPLNVATYNGGLFDPARHPFIEQYTVGDAHLQRAIDTLTRVDGQFIDYRDLAEQHLGTIYEGLLEYHLGAIEPEAGWTVDLFNDRGERKRTGSYYTPNYIVKYIVDKAVGPVLREAVEGKETDAEKVDAVLRLNVLDPAMGSGYFLVEATEYIARFLIDLDLDPGVYGAEEPDLAYWKRRVVQSCIYGVDLNPLAVDLAKLSLWLSTVAKDQPLSFLDHHLRTGNSLVGSWVDDLQLEQSGGKKRRRKTKADRQRESGQLSLLEDDAFTRSISTAVDSMWLIEGITGTTVEDVKQQEKVYEEIREQLIGKYGRLADLSTATHFGLEIAPDLRPILMRYATERTVGELPQLARVLEQAEEIASRERFFHWELEFPEVFFDGHGQRLGDAAGFDAVIGNPPYVRQERIAPYKPYLESFYEGYQSTADLYLYFYERGIELLQEDGRMGYITSGTFTRGNFAKKFRALLPTIAQIEEVIDFGENQPFEGAEMVRPSILVFTKGPQRQPFRCLFISQRIPASLDEALDARGFVCDPDSLDANEWVFQPAEITRLARKLLGSGQPLASVVGGRLYRGLLTGLNEAFVIDGQTFERLADDVGIERVAHPCAQGQDLRPWYQEDEDRWLIAIPSGWTREVLGADLEEDEAWERLSTRFPLIADHLRPFAVPARRRGDKGEFWWELRPCDYYQDFEAPKILWPDIAKLPRFSWDESGVYLSNTGYVIPDAHPSLLGILQSRVIWFAITQICQPLRLRAGLWQYRLIRQYMNRLPIAEMSDSDRSVIGDYAMQISKLANYRYQLHQRVRNRILTDLGTPDGKLNQKLTAWWDLDFSTFRAEIKKVFKREIPVGERHEWETWLADQQAEHERLTAEIIRLETELNERVYALYDLTPDEIKIIEDVTKYEYGEV